MQNIIDRFIRYVKINTQSDPESSTCPSTERQWNLANIIAKDLKDIGLTNVLIDDNSYITATLEANSKNLEIPCIGFISHFDTSPDFNGESVNPQIIKNYDGKDIILNTATGFVLSPSYFEELKDYIGNTIIATDGNSLLGADDKSGITAIISAMEYLIMHPEIEHGKIRIGFTPDEEIGRGAKLFDVKNFGAKWAYTIDGGALGELEYENFNAAGAKITIHGKSVHPGYAYGKMINACLLASDFVRLLPNNETPSTTRDYDGFYHLHNMEGNVSKITLDYIIRDHDMQIFQLRKEFIAQQVEKMNQKYGENTFEIEIENQYFNMKNKIEPVKFIVDIAERAMLEAGIKVIKKPIRGGTDGAQLSFKGLPCPNIFTGGHNFHGPYEYIPAESMLKSIQTIVNICKIVVNSHGL